jgi:hypothetical protein
MDRVIPIIIHNRQNNLESNYSQVWDPLFSFETFIEFYLIWHVFSYTSRLPKLPSISFSVTRLQMQEMW